MVVGACEDLDGTGDVMKLMLRLKAAGAYVCEASGSMGSQ